MNEKHKSSSNHELKDQVLSQYVDNRIKLIQEVFSLIKPKKILSMAPEYMKNMQVSEVKSLLSEELLGISNKRLRSILSGENVNTDSSSSSEAEIQKKQSSETISLQEITDDSCIDIELSEHERLEVENDTENLVEPKTQIKTEPKRGNKRKDSGKHKKKSSHKKIAKVEAEPVNVLNLLELQARARAIRSQLANEMISETTTKNTHEMVETVEEVFEAVSAVGVEREPNIESNLGDSPNSVICLSPDNFSVVSVYSNSDLENTLKSSNINNQDVILPQEEFPNQNNTSDYIDSSKKDELRETDEVDSDPWKTRWLESKKIQDVIKTTKIYNNLRQSRKLKTTNSDEIIEEKDNSEAHTVENSSILSQPDVNDSIKKLD